ncbi:hypothetical protein DSO57_1025575 [Entomophthora muscae]|uniref:Uncharacterized protein n=1 Tax=Entomophthora muscae TaxID=34485 RepID=A0ACC2SF92_9FUNG|nr:hypothetical protein DSO57_1025575 [Entomophthora muscae]
MSFTSCWMEFRGSSPSFPQGGNLLSLACLLRHPQSPLWNPVLFLPSWPLSRTPLILPCPAPSLNTPVTI